MKIVLLSLATLLTTSLHAGTPKLTIASFEHEIVYAKVISVERQTLVAVRKHSKNLEGKLISEAVDVSREIVFRYLNPGNERTERDVFSQNYGKVSEKELDRLMEVARKHDEEIAAKHERDYLAACAEAGVPDWRRSKDLYDQIILRGTATIRVLESFSDTLKKDDEVKVSWDHVYQVSCPPTRPGVVGSKVICAIPVIEGKTARHYIGYSTSLAVARKLYSQFDRRETNEGEQEDGGKSDK